MNYLCLSIGGEIQNYFWGLEHVHHHSRHLNCPHSEKTGQDLKKLNSSIVIYFSIENKKIGKTTLVDKVLRKYFFGGENLHQSGYFDTLPSSLSLIKNVPRWS